MPAQLYFGPDDSETFCVKPHEANYSNVGVDPASYTVTQGVPVDINVRVQNHGDTEAVDCQIDLYWSVPTTGFLPELDKRIGTWTSSIAPRADFDPFDGSFEATVSYAMPVVGHFCLLGQVKCDSLGLYPDNSFGAARDPQQAIHNVEVIAPVISPKPSKISFIFQATNPLREAVATRLVANPIDPAKNPDFIKRLVAGRGVYKFARKGTQFHMPAQVNLGIGVERIVRRVARTSIAGRKLIQAEKSLQFGHIGVVPTSTANHLFADKSQHHADTRERELDLLPWESRQAIVQLTPTNHDGGLHAIEIHHETKEANPRNLGGLVVIYRQPRTFMRD